jgi:hypothetical protein
MRSQSSQRIFLVALAVLAAGPLGAKVFLSADEALRLVFGDAAVEHRTVFLTAGQRAEAQKLAGSEIKSALATPYHATRNGKDAGTAYFDTHVVRTLPETLMVVVDPQGKVTRVEVLAFAEPEDYLPPGAWYGQFRGQGLSGDLALGHRIRSVTGASLTARATTEAVRRVLAIHQVLRGAAAKP